MSTKRYDVFVRTWWKHNPAWPGGREPGAGRPRYLIHSVTEQVAREICRDYNETHAPGFLSKKAEYREA